MGKIYVLVNASMPGLVKIGYTEREAEERVIELSSATGVPTEFEIFRIYEVGDSAAFERRIHEKLRAYRVNGNREFFRLDAEDAAHLIEEELTNHDGASDGASGLDQFEHEDELVRQATELTKEAAEIWPGKIAGALKVPHEKACEIYDTLKERRLVDENGACLLYLQAVRQRKEQVRVQRNADARGQEWVENENPSRPFSAAEALAYVVVVVGIVVAVQANKFEQDKAIVAGVMISAFGMLLILKFRKG